MLAQCPLCVFKGCAVVESHQMGIVVHGTHRALVAHNVLWNARQVRICGRVHRIACALTLFGGGSLPLVQLYVACMVRMCV